MKITRVNGVRAAYDAFCTDIGIGGIGLETEIALRAGQVIEFDFPGHEDCMLHYRARILHREGKHYGAYFLDVG